MSFKTFELFEQPRQALQFSIFIVFCLWQSLAALLGLLGFIFVIRWIKVTWWVLLLLGTLIAIITFLPALLSDSLHNLQILQQGFQNNIEFWRLLLFTGATSAFQFTFEQNLNYVLGLPLFFAGLFAVIELIPHSAHEKRLQDLQYARLTPNQEIAASKIEKQLAQLNEKDYEQGTVLGVSKYSAEPIIVTDDLLNQLMLVLGTTGGGKTITLRRFYQRAIQNNYPLIIIDGKPTEENTAWLANLAKTQQRTFYGFNCCNYANYDPLAQGGYTELKDKIISLKDEWESDYYRSIAEDYLQTTFEVLLASQESYDLKKIIECLDYEELALLVRKIDDERLQSRVKRLANYERKDITGLQAHLSLLIHSELGDYFNKNENTFNLVDAVKKNGIVYFALPALRYPSFSKVLGKLIINDIKTVIDRENTEKRIFTVFDEFSVFAGEQVLNLVNMGRAKGIHAIFGTQGLADLKKVSPDFANQILNCVNSIICHRLNDQESAETVAMWVGTRDVFDVTAQIDLKNARSGGLGSVRRNKEFIIHPDAIKQELQPGEAFYVSKVGRFVVEKVRVKLS